MAGSSPVFRSKTLPVNSGWGFFKSDIRRLGGGTGRHAGLRSCSLDEQNLSALREIEDVELRKFGEPFKMGIPSEARKGTCRD